MKDISASDPNDGIRRPLRSRRRRFAVARSRATAMLFLLMSTSGCVSNGPLATLAAPAPIFAPQAFFAGRTIGEGVLHVTLSRARPVRVVGDGQVGPGGTLTLTQRVEEGSKPPRDRVWHLRPTAEGRYAVDLSDAIGRVEADVVGNRLHLRFRAKGGLDIEQWIYLQPDRQTALNRMVVRKFGLPVASLRETIRRGA